MGREGIMMGTYKFLVIGIFASIAVNAVPAFAKDDPPPSTPPPAATEEGRRIGAKKFATDVVADAEAVKTEAATKEAAVEADEANLKAAKETAPSLGQKMTQPVR